MKQEYSVPFINSTKEMLLTMVGISCELSTVCVWAPCDFISGTIFLYGASEGQLTLSFPTETARNIVSEVLGMDKSEMDDEMLRDGVGEMANIVAGNVKSALSDSPYKLQLSLPTIRLGRETVPQGVDKYENQIQTELGDFYLVYWLALPK